MEYSIINKQLILYCFYQGYKLKYIFKIDDHLIDNLKRIQKDLLVTLSLDPFVQIKDNYLVTNEIKIKLKPINIFSLILQDIEIRENYKSFINLL